MLLVLEKRETKKLEHCVYVLHSLKDKKLYIGYTSDLRERLTDHFKGRSRSTAPRRPFILLFCEYFLSKQDAIRRERYFKTAPGKRALRLMLRESMQEVENHKLTNLT